jgi:hypothetical protein
MVADSIDIYLGGASDQSPIAHDFIEANAHFEPQYQVILLHVLPQLQWHILHTNNPNIVA